LPGPIAEGRKPAGKGLSTGADASNPAAPAWAGAETRLPGGEGRPDDLPVADRQWQARTDLTRVKSVKKKALRQKV
jgi:hypothetical protein